MNTPRISKGAKARALKRPQFSGMSMLSAIDVLSRIDRHRKYKKGKYQPHQGKRECARRVRQMTNYRGFTDE